MTPAQEFAYKLTAFRNANDDDVRRRIGMWLVANLSTVSQDDLPAGVSEDDLGDELNGWKDRDWKAEVAEKPRKAKKAKKPKEEAPEEDAPADVDATVEGDDILLL